MSKNITRVIPRTKVTAEFVNPATKEFYDKAYKFNGEFVNAKKAKQLINNTLIGEDSGTHPILTKIYGITHELVRYTMPVQMFCDNAVPEVISVEEGE